MTALSYSTLPFTADDVAAEVHNAMHAALKANREPMAWIMSPRAMRAAVRHFDPHYATVTSGGGLLYGVPIKVVHGGDADTDPLYWLLALESR